MYFTFSCDTVTVLLLPAGWGGGYPWSQTPTRGGGYDVLGEVMGMSGGCAGDMSGRMGVVLRVTTAPQMTPSGSHHMYGRHVDSTHPTGMLSYCVY